MRLHYYRFPKGIDDATRAANGAEDFENTCEINPARWNDLVNPSANCPHKNGETRGCRGCSHLKCVKAEDIISGISITRAKELLINFGGSAWTSHIDRDGGVFETTEIKLKGNNSRPKYNRHL